MFDKNLLSESFGRAFIGQDAWEAIIEIAVTRQAMILSCSEIKPSPPKSEAFMFEPTIESIFDAKLRVVAMNARDRAGKAAFNYEWIDIRNRLDFKSGDLKYTFA